jgi:hypothetical protein
MAYIWSFNRSFSFVSSEHFHVLGTLQAGLCLSLYMNIQFPPQLELLRLI